MWLLLLLHFVTRACNNATPCTPFVLDGLFLLVLLFFLRFLRCFLYLPCPAHVIVRLIDVVNQVVDIFLINLLIPCLFRVQLLIGTGILVFRLSLLSFIVETETVH